MPDETLLSPVVLAGISLIFGLLVGSFLNVVIYRIPLQLEKGWQRDARDFLGLDPEPAEEDFNIAFPSSHCPACGTEIKPWHNLPIISYLLLKGKCSSCTQTISLQYPITELTTGLMTAFVVFTLGLTGSTILVLLFSWSLISLTGIDLKHKLLPDNITLPLMWLGLISNLNATFVPIGDAVIGAAAGYLTLWSIFWAFKLLTGKEGMGHGDFKLLAALGAWMGWQMLPLIILLSSVVGALAGIAGIIIMGRDKQIPIAFGPYLAVAGWVALFWGNDIISSYMAYL